ncbi:MAG: hypothetical protein QW471_01640 [Candidatus Woesearchaeota archaeon]
MRITDELIYLLTFLLLLPSVSAYIDPGTGGIVVGSIWPYLLFIFSVIAGFFIKILFRPMKKVILKLWRWIKSLKMQNGD